ncbi:xaa-Pro aminopeptidase 1-like [Saccoglossus kowalevskii]
MATLANAQTNEYELGRYQVLIRFKSHACFFTLVTSQQTRNCAKSPPQKAPTAIDTSSKLNRLRRDMADFNLLAAYLITPKDAHQSEYTAAHEMRLQYISGFDGYEGLGVVTTDKALLWTLEKYRERAEELVDCNWEIFTPGSENYIEPENWLYENMETSSRIGADMTYLTFAEHERFVNAFQGELIISKIPGLIDDLWNSDGNRPPRPTGTLMSVSTQYTGASWLSKVNTIRDKMSEKNVGAMVLTDLVDISWVFNLRGADTPYNPLFFAYAIIKQDTVNLYVDGGRIDGTGIPVCTGSEDKSSCVTTNFYTGFMSDLAQLAAVGYGDLWMEESASYAVIDSVKDFNAGFITEISPIKQIRSRKNVREQESIQNVQIRDSVAVCAFMQWLENEMKSGNNPTELSAMGKLKYFREKSENYRGDSIPPISAYGSHAATIDHTPTIYNDMTINTTGLYLFDSGAQYIDGATDMSRTLHFGTPSKNETDAYTTVLRALIRLAVTVFPKGMYGGELDFLTRTPLWKAGMTYPHATGHGLGAFVAHEDPIRLEKRNGISSVDEIPIQTNMYISNGKTYH